MLSVGHTRRLIRFSTNPDVSHCFCRQLADFRTPVFGAHSASPSQFSTAAEEPKEVFARPRIELSKSTIKKVKRQPFAKNFFHGRIDTDLMAFPEILSKPLLKDVENYVQSINDFYKDKVDSNKISVEGKIPEDLLSEFKEMGLFGRLVPSEYGGLNLSYTALLRLNEALSLDWSVFATLAAHEFFAAQAILIAGNENQKAKYLPDLASGKRIGALCSSEPISGSDLNSISTSAHLVTGKNSFSLSGTKHWVSNGNIADVFIVFAKMHKIRDETEDEISAFIVDRNSEGISISTENNKSGLRGIGTSTVNFRNVEVPYENLLGNIGDGALIILKVLEVCHLGMASFTFGTLKELLDLATEHIINTMRYEKPMTSLPLIRHRLGRIATTIYAMESTAYFTAGLLDSTIDPDCAVECAILKVFNSEGTLFCLKELMKIIGCASILKGHVLERYYHDAEALESFEGTNDVARLFISLLGLHHVAQKKTEMVTKIRNPFFFPIFAFNAVWRQSRIMHGKVYYNQDVAGHLHPSLVVPGNRLEECVQKLEVLVEYVLKQHGKDVVYHQLDPVVLADIVIDLYTMSATLARSSRSYCIGLQNSDPEMRMTFAFCHEAYFRILQHFKKLKKGVYENSNEHYLKIAEQLIDWRGYYPEHPLKYNF